MKISFLTLLLILTIKLSYSQEKPFKEVKFDPKLQIIHKDTLKNIGERLTGKWKYLGKKVDKIFLDTISVSYYESRTVTTTIENGIVFELENDTKKKVNYFYELTYNFKNGKSSHSFEKVLFDKSITYVTSCQPTLKLIYYEGKFGIFFNGMTGDHFTEINRLTSERLIFENEKEYIKLE